MLVNGQHQGQGWPCFTGEVSMKKFSWIGAVLLGIIALAVGIALPGCRTGQAQSRKGEANAFEQTSKDGPSCRFG